MRTRHRIPTIFNLSMVDVLCCALGCVILLWLLNLREAKRQTDEAGKAEELLAAAQTELTETRNDLTAARKSLDYAEQSLQTTRAELQSAREQSSKLQATIASLQDEKRTVEDRAGHVERTASELRKNLEATSKHVTTLEGQVRAKEAQAEMSARRAADLTEKLDAALARVKQLGTLADQVPTLQEETKSYQDKYVAQETRLKSLEKEIARRGQELTESEKKLDELRSDKKALQREADQARAAVENRFAGINLTGRRVVFLVDMSGSMELVDENTPAPSKWLGVRETVAKVLGSLPELEKFQIIIFSEKPSFLLGKQWQWIDYDARSSREQVLKALADIKPKGGTNMSSAMETVFSLRAAGLDTVYFLSDGLPNTGAGLTPEQERTLKETQRCEILSTYIRKKLKTDWNRPRPDQPRVRINTIGFFYESPDVGAFLWALARENEGSFVGMSHP
jgi:predicted  nucleic acid-binding Zn-ribbon protein